MSGEQDRSGAKPAQNPFFDESDAPPRRAKRAKPPPGIITAGGVDMARAHASGIQVREGTAAETTLDQPRVVVAVETDPRKVPTHKKLLDGRDAGEEGARSAMLPGTGGDATPWSASAPAAVDRRALPASGTAAPQIDPDAETLKRDRQRLPAWMRVAAVLVLLLLAAGVVRRARLAVAVPDQPALPALAALPVAPPPVVTAPAIAATATAVTAPRETAAPEPPRPAVTAATTAEPEPRATPTATARVVKAPAPPKPIYTPPFQLPGEKN